MTKIAIAVALLFLLSPLSCPATEAVPSPSPAQKALQAGLQAAGRQDYKAALGYFLEAREADPYSPAILFDAALASAQLPERELRTIALFKAYLMEAPDAPNAEAVRKEVKVLEERFEERMAKLLDQLQNVLITYNDLPLEKWFAADNAKLRRESFERDGWFLASARYYLGDTGAALKGLRATNGRNWQEAWSAQWKSESTGTNEWRHYDTDPLVSSMASAGLFGDALELMDHIYEPKAMAFYLEQGDVARARKIASFGGKDGWLALACSAHYGTEPGDVFEDDDNHQTLRTAMAEVGVSQEELKKMTCSPDLWWSQSRSYFLRLRGFQGYRLNHDHDDTNLADFIAQGSVKDPSLYDFNTLFSAMAELAREYRKIKGPEESRLDSLPEAYYHQGGWYIIAGKRDRAVACFTRAIELDPKYVNAYYNRGYSYAILGEADKAQADFAKVIKLDPQNVEGLQQHSLGCESVKDLNCAIEDYGKLIKLNPQKGNWYLARGKNYEAQLDFDRALTDYGTSIELAPGSAPAYFQRGHVLQTLGSTGPADDDFAKAIKLDSAYASQYAEMLSTRADSYEAIGKHDWAIAAFSKAIELRPDDLGNYAKRGDLYEAKGEHDLAIADFGTVVEGDPDYGYGWFRRGDAYRAKGETEKALADYQKAIALDSGEDNDYRAGLYTARGNAYFEIGELDKALADYNKVAELDPKGAYIHFNRGLVYYELGEFDRAIAEYRETLRLDPKYEGVQENLEKATSAKGTVDEITRYNMAIAANPRGAEAYRKRAEFYDRKGQRELAAADFDKLIELKPVDAEAYSLRGDWYQKEKEYDKAIADYSKAIEFKPNDAVSYFKRAVAYFVKAQLNKMDAPLIDNSIADYTKGISLNPYGYVTSYYYLASLYAEKKDAEQACLWLKKGIALHSETWGRVKGPLLQYFNNISDAPCYKAIKGN